MKRLHVHVSVTDLDRSIAFYSGLFAAAPAVVHPDYAKWELDDPRVNFAISARGAPRGLNHLGIQVDDEAELAEVTDRLHGAGGPVLQEGHTTCCYAQSEKSWAEDPAGLSWEVFRTYGDSAVYGNEGPVSGGRLAPAPGMPQPAAAPAAAPRTETPCCTPAEQAAGCCTPAEAAAGYRAVPQPAAACCAPSPGAARAPAAACCTPAGIAAE